MQDVEVLLRRALRDGDRGAFDALHAATYPSVLRMAMVHVRSSDEAEDIVQAAFLILHKRGRRIGNQRAFSVWMWRTVRFLSLRLQREKKRREGAEMNQPDQRQKDDQTGLGELLDKLSADDRRILLLRYFDGLSVEEVGRALNLTTAAAQMRIGRALDRAKRKGGPGLLAVLLGLASAGDSDAVVPPSPLTGNVSLRTHQLASSYSGAAVVTQGLTSLGIPLLTSSGMLAGTLALGIWWMHRPPSVDLARLDEWAKQMEGRYRGLSESKDWAGRTSATDALVVIRRMRNPDRLELRKQDGDRPVDSLIIYPILGRNEVSLDGKVYPARFASGSMTIMVPKHVEEFFIVNQKIRDEVSVQTDFDWHDGNFRYRQSTTGSRFWVTSDLKLKRASE